MVHIRNKGCRTWWFHPSHVVRRSRPLLFCWGAIDMVAVDKWRIQNWVGGGHILEINEDQENCDDVLIIVDPPPPTNTTTHTNLGQQGSLGVGQENMLGGFE